MFIRWSLEAGFGLQRDALKGKAPTSARQYGPFLEGLGFTQVNTTGYLEGDIAVIQGYPGGTSDANGVPYGHVQMYNGNQWVSDFFQGYIGVKTGYEYGGNGFMVYSIDIPPTTIYRIGN